jgi:hypothetical protein
VAASRTTAGWQVIATAVCASPLTGYSIQSATSNFTQTTSQTAQAACPPGRSVIGAGASLSNGFGQVSIAELRLSTPPNNTTVSASAITDKDGYTGNWSVTAYAICADPLPGWTPTDSVSARNNNSTKVQPAFCATGKSPVGGGWSLPASTAPTDIYITRLAITTAADPNVTAAATAATTTTSNWGIITQSICANT